MEIQGEVLTGAPQLSFVGWESSHTARGSCSVTEPDNQASKHGCAMCQLSRWSALRSVERTKEYLHDSPGIVPRLEAAQRGHAQWAQVTPLSCLSLTALHSASLSHFQDNLALKYFDLFS